ncbi:MAG TPA: hypothetical protein VE821_08325, partial [Pyrinomonadaceae bacterium]|nr:hypothetical protein [Pyrinomonadaceae bacterium]
IDDEYMFGSDLLVAPLMESGTGRNVYLPLGAWIDYQTGRVYHGAEWQQIEAGRIPVVLLVRDHAVIPHVKPAQSTNDIDWNDVELRVFSTDKVEASGLFTLPQGELQTLRLAAGQQGYALVNDPLAGRVKWRITHVEMH